MANKKHYYIGVYTCDGLKFVTKIDNGERMAHWNTTEPPKEFSKKIAEDIVEGLTWNFYTAVVVESFYQLDKHFTAYDPESGTPIESGKATDNEEKE